MNRSRELEARRTHLRGTAYDCGTREATHEHDRLERDEYNSPFEALEDWHLLRAIAFQREELIEPYIHLLDIEAYDEA